MEIKCDQGSISPTLMKLSPEGGKTPQHIINTMSKVRPIF
jgi:hypothetical protein